MRPRSAGRLQRAKHPHLVRASTDPPHNLRVGMRSPHSSSTINHRRRRALMRPRLNSSSHPLGSTRLRLGSRQGIMVLNKVSKRALMHHRRVSSSQALMRLPRLNKRGRTHHPLASRGAHHLQGGQEAHCQADPADLEDHRHQGPRQVQLL